MQNKINRDTSGRIQTKVPRRWLSSFIVPRISVQDDAGNLTTTSILRDRYDAYRTSIDRILSDSLLVQCYY
jgi:hypothetical protein